MRQKIQFVCGLAVFAAFFVSPFNTLTYVNRVTVHWNRDKYRPETLVVTGADLMTDEDGSSWWLKGTVGGNEERFIPNLHGAPPPQSAKDLAARFPAGTKIEVYYNPEATRTLIQGESLRVLEATPDFWQKEDELRRKLAPRVLIPLPAALILYLTVRLVNRRHARRVTMH